MFRIIISLLLTTIALPAAAETFWLSSLNDAYPDGSVERTAGLDLSTRFRSLSSVTFHC